MVKKLIARAQNNHLIKSSAVFFIGSIIASFGSYLYQLSMGRMLSVVEYGELQSLLSIFTIISLPSAALSLIVTKYSSRYSRPEELGKIKALLVFLSKKFTYLGIGIFLILTFFSQYVAIYLQIKEPAKVILISFIFIFIFSVSINKGLLQGLQKFKQLSAIGILETFGKLLFALLFVFMGWQVYGAVGGVIIGSLAGYLASFWPIKKALMGSPPTITGGLPIKAQIIEREELKDLIKYSLPVFFSILGVTLFFSLDIILAKHYFSPELAGAYGAISILGRAIYFTTGPISQVLFSVSAKEHQEGKNYQRSFFLSLMMVVSMCLAAIVAYFSFPKLIIVLLLGNKYFYIAPYLGWYAVAITFLSLISLVINFLLSIRMTKCVYIVLVGVAAMFGGITIWHESIKQLILVMNVVMGLVLLVLFYYYFRYHKREA